MEFPREVVMGHDALLNVDDVCKKLKLGGSAAVVSDNTTRKIAGEKVYEIMCDGGYEPFIIEISEASDSEVSRLGSEGLSNNVSFMAAVGGGTVIDTAKVASKNMGIPFISIPTAASHDGIASSRASIHNGRQTTSVPASAPVGVIADTGIIASSPKRLTISGCGDIISNYTAVMDWQLARQKFGVPYSEYAAALSTMTAEMIIKASDSIKPDNEESVRIVIKALVSSGVAMSIAGTSHPASGSEHKFSHALDMVAEKPALHGEQCGVGTIMMMYLHRGDWELIRDSLKNLGAPTNASKLGVSDEEVIQALIMANKIRPERHTILDNGFSRKAAEHLAVETGVIR